MEYKQRNKATIQGKLNYFLECKRQTQKGLLVFIKFRFPSTGN